MKLIFVFVVLVHAVIAGDFLMETTHDLFAKWSKFKAMESCFGEQVMRKYLLKMKHAHAKCMNTELPPDVLLDQKLSTTKLIRSLMEGSAQVQKETVTKLKKALGLPETTAYGFQLPVAIPVATYQPQKVADEDPFRKLFKKMSEKMFDNEKSDIDDDLFETFFKRLMAGHTRQKREDFVVDNLEENSPGLTTELGDRLKEKLAEQKENFASKLSNCSCILRELKFVDENNEIQLESILDEVKSCGIENEWLVEKIVADKKLCYARAQSLPEEVLNGCMLGPQWAKIKEFMQCSKEAKMKTCMAFDTKQKLEKDFGPIDKLKTQAGLGEHELLIMAAKVVFGDMDLD